MNTLMNVLKLEKKGPWKTKSSADLNVLFAYDYSCLQKFFFGYDQQELNNIPVDIRGLRLYKVSGIPKNSIGANEWHKIRNEIAITISGVVEWNLIDFKGNSKNIVLGINEGILIPNHILHTYKALEENSSILVIANTLFNPDDISTHDTYSNELFIKKYG